MTKLVFASLDDMAPSFTLLELIPDTHAWVKDRQGHFVFGNRLFYERFGISSMQGLVGRDDFDLAPADMARRYRDDDDQVLKGSVITDRLELIGGPDGSVEWFLTSKWPVHDPAGAIQGSFGMSRHLNRSERKTVSYRDLNAPITLSENISPATCRWRTLRRPATSRSAPWSGAFTNTSGKPPGSTLRKCASTGRAGCCWRPTSRSAPSPWRRDSPTTPTSPVPLPASSDSHPAASGVGARETRQISHLRRERLPAMRASSSHGSGPSR